MTHLAAAQAYQILADVLNGRSAARIARDRSVPAAVVAALAAQHGHPKAAELRAARDLYAGMRPADPVEVTPRGMEAFKPLPEPQPKSPVEKRATPSPASPVNAPGADFTRMLTDARTVGLGELADRIEGLVAHLLDDLETTRAREELRAKIAEHEAAIEALKGELLGKTQPATALVCIDCGYAAKNANGLGVHRSRTHKAQESA